MSEQAELNHKYAEEQREFLTKQRTLVREQDTYLMQRYDQHTRYVTDQAEYQKSLIQVIFFIMMFV